MAGLTVQLRFLSKVKKKPLRTFEEDKGALLGAVHSAIMDNSYKRLQLLIDASFAIDVRNHHNLTPLHLACSRGRLNMIKLLINNGASTKTRTGIPHKSPMQLAAAGGHLEVMVELAKHGYDWKEKDDWGWTLLHEVAAVSNAEAIRWVCSRSRCMTNVADKLGRTPLLTALIAGGGLDTVQELLSHGEDIAKEDEVGRNAAEASILYCCPDVIQIILDATKKDSENEIDIDILLLIAEDHSLPRVVKKIIEDTLM